MTDLYRKTHDTSNENELDGSGLGQADVREPSRERALLGRQRPLTEIRLETAACVCSSARLLPRRGVLPPRCIDMPWRCPRGRREQTPVE